MELFWPILYPSLIGVVCLAYLAWCVLRAAPDAEKASPDDDPGPRGRRRDPRRPRSPRRGPHAPGRLRTANRAMERR
ncbi:MAG: hypothetical protein ACRDMH_06320 [Solirubrobacterales bacterium]